MRILGISTERAEASQIASQILSLGKSLAGKLLGEGAIMPEELEVVEYGIDSLFDNLWGLAVTLMVGFVFRFFWGSFLLWLFVFPLRKYAGGFHAKTKTRCRAFSITVLVLSTVCFQLVQWKKNSLLIIMIVLFFLIYFTAPIDTVNKKLDRTEKTIYRRRTRLILTAEGLVFILAFFIDMKTLMLVLPNAFLIVEIALLAGKIGGDIQNKFRKK